jgi:chromosome segregation ATPase
MKNQFKSYCEEIKFLYDKEKDKLRAKITELTNKVSLMEKDKENDSESIQSSMREVNIIYHKKLDFLQKELLDTRTEASSRIIELTQKLEYLQSQNKDYEQTISSLRQK